MSPSPAEPDRPSASYGNLGPHHWSVARKDSNQEALEYYRSRSHAPGVAEGGGERNFYCMQCDGVVPFDFAGPRCPHCDAELDVNVRRFFNWVELDGPPKSDARALLGVALRIAAALALLALLVWLLFEVWTA